MRLLYKSDLIRLGKSRNSLMENTICFCLKDEVVTDVFFSETPIKDLIEYKGDFDVFHILKYETKDKALNELAQYRSNFKMDQKPVPLVKSENQVRILKNTYIKKDDRYYFNIGGLIYTYENEGKVYELEGIEYRHPDNSFGDLENLIK